MPMPWRRSATGSCSTSTTSSRSSTSDAPARNPAARRPPTGSSPPPHGTWNAVGCRVTTGSWSRPPMTRPSSNASRRTPESPSFRTRFRARRSLFASTRKPSSSRETWSTTRTAPPSASSAATSGPSFESSPPASSGAWSARIPKRSRSSPPAIRELRCRRNRRCHRRVGPLPRRDCPTACRQRHAPQDPRGLGRRPPCRLHFHRRRRPRRAAMASIS